MVSGRLEFQLDDARVAAGAGDFGWVPAWNSAYVRVCVAGSGEYLSGLTGPPDASVLDAIGSRHGAPTVGPPIIASNAPATESSGEVGVRGEAT